MNALNNVTVMIEGVEVEARVKYRTASDLGIELLRPYGNLSTGSHIPVYGRRFCSFIGEYGDKRIIDMMKELYEIGRFIDENFSAMEQQFIALQSELNERAKNQKSPENAKEQMRLLKQRMRNGEMDFREYHRQLKSIRNASADFSFKTSRLIDHFFEMFFPMSVTMETRDDALGILRRKLFRLDSV